MKNIFKFLSRKILLFGIKIGDLHITHVSMGAGRRVQGGALAATVIKEISE